MDEKKITELVFKAKEGNETALQLLLKEFKPMIFNVVKSLYAPGADYNDLFQEGFIGFWTAVRDYDPEVVNDSRFEGFAKMVVTRRVKTFITMSNRQKHKPLNKAVSLDKPVTENNYSGSSYYSPLINYISSVPSAEDILLKKEDEKDWEKKWSFFLEQLSKLELNVLRYYLQGKKYSEIAEDIGCNKKAVDNALTRIKQKVRRLLLKEQKELSA
ncbi:MAG: sigma-70 family RNA polymerase sigma factor [Thermosipho sp. (in: Bacteria)]|nr:sigma-70 family RNA polymerase sigma factor [Thermosipho sp. (in: thermotogales)]